MSKASRKAGGTWPAKPEPSKRDSGLLGGHENRTNMKHFIAWANTLLKHTPLEPARK